jgi:hypothetical protein
MSAVIAWTRASLRHRRYLKVFNFSGGRDRMLVMSQDGYLDFYELLRDEASLR